MVYFFFLPLVIAFTIYNGWGIGHKIFGDHTKPKEQKTVTRLDLPAEKQKDIEEGRSTPIQNADFKPLAPEEKFHPYQGFTFTIKGSISSKRINTTYFELTKENKTVFIDTQKLEKLGYVVSQDSDCSAFLFYEGARVVATCANENAPDGALSRAGGGVFQPPKPLTQRTEPNPPLLGLDRTPLDASPSV